MKIVVASDSHGHTEILEKIVNKEKADFYLHCGDSCDTSEDISPFVSVKGNCDLFKYDRELVLKLGKFRFLITHGHLTSFLNLKYRAIGENINIVLTGHTHIPHMEIIDNILFINPGSVARPRGGSQESYCVLEYDNNETDITKINVEIKRVF